MGSGGRCLCFVFWGGGGEGVGVGGWSCSWMQQPRPDTECHLNQRVAGCRALCRRQKAFFTTPDRVQHGDVPRPGPILSLARPLPSGEQKALSDTAGQARTLKSTPILHCVRMSHGRAGPHTAWPISPHAFLSTICCGRVDVSDHHAIISFTRQRAVLGEAPSRCRNDGSLVRSLPILCDASTIAPLGCATSLGAASCWVALACRAHGTCRLDTPAQLADRFWQANQLYWGVNVSVSSYHSVTICRDKWTSPRRPCRPERAAACR